MKNITRTELVWVGKYDEQGNLRPVERTILPFQVVETVNESKADREKAQRDLFTLMPRDDTWRNMLIWGDNKVVMSSLLPRFAGKINLIYIDPPFATGQDFSYKVRIGDEEFVKEPSIIEAKAYRDTWGRGLDSYLQMMYDRLVLMRELLAEDGFIFVHLDWHVAHYIKVLMDEIFGESNFRNEIIVRRTAKHTMHQFETFESLQVAQDNIIFYSKSPKTKFKPPYREASSRQKEGSWHALFNRADRPTMRYPLLGKSISHGQWMWEKERAYKAVENYKEFIEKYSHKMTLKEYWISTGRTLEFVRANPSTGEPEYWVAPKDEVPCDTNWLDIQAYSFGHGFATEKSETLLERIIRMASKPEDIVADFFCVRKGTRVWKVEAPPVVLPARGGQPNSLPACGEGWGGGSLIPIECIQSGDWVLAYDGRPHRVVRTFRRLYRGLMVGIQHSESPAILWLTADHRVLAKLRPRSLGGHADWSATPIPHLERRKQLRRGMTPPGRKLWQALRNERLGVKFRRQHPIGSYFADFYSREARLVVEVDGAAAHSGEAAVAYDRARDAYMQSLGLRVFRIPAYEVEHHLQSVLEAIKIACEEVNTSDGAEWIKASELCVGDTVFVGPERIGVRIERIQRVFSEEEVYDLEVEGAHSYITEVCVVHNCGSGTTLAVAEKLGRRWIGCDLSKWAIQVTRKRLLQIQGCKPFEILNLGNYERHKLAANGQWGRYVQFILQLYRAEPITGFQTLHGKKARAYVHVGSVDSPITMREIRQTLKEAQGTGAREVHFLGWDFEMGLHDLVSQVGEDHGVKVRMVSIPREALEVTNPAQEEVRFFDLNYLELEHKVTGKTLTIRLKDFIIANPEYIPEEVRQKITKFTDYIDYWAVDWDYKDDTFHNGWQSFRTRKHPKLETEATHTYEQPGTYKVLVKVVDIFGNDTTKMVEVEVK